MLAVLWTQQRCSRVCGYSSAKAAQNPSPPSPTARAGPSGRPSKSAQKARCDVRTEGSFAEVFESEPGQPTPTAEDLGDGTYQVSGRWQWGSGTQNAQWIMGGCLITKDGKPEMLPGMLPNTRMFFRPASEVTIHDTWHVSGLKGTGSNDIEFPPARLHRDYSVGLTTDKPIDGALYAFPPFGLLSIGIGGVSLGLARAAIDALGELAGAKTPEGHRRPLAQRAETQEKVAEAEALYASSRAWLHAVIAAAWDAAQRSGAITIEHRRDLRLATSHATRSCARAIDLMYNLGGGTSVYETSRLQRCFRDIHVATQHMLVATPTLELAGRLFLGLEAETSML